MRLKTLICFVCVKGILGEFVEGYATAAAAAATGDASPQAPRLRETESWIPSKKIRMFNMKSMKMGNKTVKYGDGGLVLLRCVMDNKMYRWVQGTQQRTANCRLSVVRDAVVCTLVY